MKRLGIVLMVALFLNTISCGKPSEEDQVRSAGGIPVTGTVGFGTQCPFGTVEAPIATRLQLWKCPIEIDKLELAEGIEPFYLQTDCKKKLISVRTDSRRLDSLWEVLPDGSFFFTVDGGTARFKSDGSGRNEACGTPMSVDFMGKMDCTDRDRAIVTFESVWWLGKSENPNAAPPQPSCKFPAGCYLYAKNTVKQCR